MLMAAVDALANLSPALHNPEASLLPDLADVRDVSVVVAAAVVRQAVQDGNARDPLTIKVVNGELDQTLEEFIKVSPRLRFSGMSADNIDRAGCGMLCEYFG